jgi:hypothetical protein
VLPSCAGLLVVSRGAGRGAEAAGLGLLLLLARELELSWRSTLGAEQLPARPALVLAAAAAAAWLGAPSRPTTAGLLLLRAALPASMGLAEGGEAPRLLELAAPAATAAAAAALLRRLRLLVGLPWLRPGGSGRSSE